MVNPSDCAALFGFRSMTRSATPFRRMPFCARGFDSRRCAVSRTTPDSNLCCLFSGRLFIATRPHSPALALKRESIAAKADVKFIVFCISLSLSLSLSLCLFLSPSLSMPLSVPVRLGPSVRRCPSVHLFSLCYLAAFNKSSLFCSMQ